jgi:hypothetical protein
LIQQAGSAVQAAQSASSEQAESHPKRKMRQLKVLQQLIGGQLTADCCRAGKLQP